MAEGHPRWFIDISSRLIGGNKSIQLSMRQGAIHREQETCVHYKVIGHQKLHINSKIGAQTPKAFYIQESTVRKMYIYSVK